MIWIVSSHVYVDGQGEKETGYTRVYGKDADE
jgi:hypothetical protein